jgi:hypothetical protein
MEAAPGTALGSCALRSYAPRLIFSSFLICLVTFLGFFVPSIFVMSALGN